MHKRIVSYVLLSLLVFSLSGCGSISSGEEEETGTRQETEQVTEKNTNEEETEKPTTENTASEAVAQTPEEFISELNRYCEQMDAEQLPAEKRWITAYAQKVLDVVETIREDCEAYDSDFQSQLDSYEFQLIYLDEDDIPELVFGPTGYFVSLYAYAAGAEGTAESGTLHPVMDQWGYGAGGNHGYVYIPGENVIYNDDTDFAGAVHYISYMNMNAEYELDSYTIESACLDEAGNVFMGSEDSEQEPQIHYYYLLDGQEQEISEEEFHSYQIQGDYKSIIGTKSSLEIMEELYQSYLTYCK